MEEGKGKGKGRGRGRDPKTPFGPEEKELIPQSEAANPQVVSLLRAAFRGMQYYFSNLEEKFNLENVEIFEIHKLRKFVFFFFANINFFPSGFPRCPF